MGQNTADLFHRPARTPIVLADMKPNHFSPTERMVEHERLHFSVRGAAPIAPRQKGVADGNFFGGRVPVVISRRPVDLARSLICNEKRTARGDRTGKETLEY